MQTCGLRAVSQGGAPMFGVITSSRSTVQHPLHTLLGEGN